MVGRSRREGNGLEEGKLVHTQHHLLLALRDNVSSFLHMCFCPSLIVDRFLFPSLVFPSYKVVKAKVQRKQQVFNNSTRKSSLGG